MTRFRTETIGDATLYLGDCRDLLDVVGPVDHVITDPPYSDRTHAGHDAIAKGRAGQGADAAERKALGYAALTPADADALAAEFARLASGWIVWMTDHTLAPSIMDALRREGRYVFAPLPFYAPGRSVRITGDGPSSWTDWIVVARTARQMKWGTLPGGYHSGPGWNDKHRMGGKPTALMAAIVSDYSRLGETVLDPFMGAGTTGVACAQYGRKFIGCEIDAAMFDVSCRRIEEATKQPRLFAEPVAKPVQTSLLDDMA